MGADKGYDVSNFVDRCRELGFTPHVAARKYSRIDGRTTRHPGYQVSQIKRKRVEEPFGWMKNYGLLGKLRHRGRENVDWLFRLTATAYNITRAASRPQVSAAASQTFKPGKPRPGRKVSLEC